MMTSYVGCVVFNAEGGVPTWNPVLFVTRKGEVLLFYKVGRTPAAWRGFLLRSTDAGVTWWGALCVVHIGRLTHAYVTP